MGTRALVVFKDDNDKEIVVMYRQFDGYPSELGRELYDFLKNKKIVNGYNFEDKREESFNGMNCLAASVVGFLKKEIGNVYLYPANEKNCGEKFIYTLSEEVDEKDEEQKEELFSRPENPNIHLKVERVKVERVYSSQILFEGNINDYVDYIE